MQRNSYFQLINKIILFTLLLTSIYPAIFAQKTISASNSELVSVQLPANASRITESNIPNFQRYAERKQTANR